MADIRVLVIATTVGLALTSCGNSDSTKAEDAADAAESGTTTAQVSPAPQSSADLPALIPAPAGAQETKGPNDISDGGVHVFFRVEGEPGAVMDAYQSELEAKGWQVTVITTSEGGKDSGGGGAVFTGTLGDAYGVIDGGGYEDKTFVDVCAWPSKPAKPVCDRGGR
ncbi:hypothetical protein [Mycolicibacterium confluentis]|uniref:Uncharacterized protein n=1 Tax=Mycolicibacterium confluentis TaxID=28047 RepID=A0A7I7XWM5_9MYCO|nr:hypothetical protein [Mycolicibacterium confluentis]MCV7321889.1 hypothetical protein [Mycolicibacterium confluentis]ORV32144.1 hypothetical protein AWB99_10835 [Mycolicibacterium confluentis]BBZ33706.1 hypothetical protein MCNF_23110 [Mycolicibacterium confluentis]